MTDTSREDGMINVLSALGSQKDVSAHTHYRRDRLLRQKELESIFAGDGLGRRIVELPAEESLRKWLTVTGDDGEAVVDALETLKAQKAVTDAYVWARLYGGAGLVRLIDDGGSLDMPLRKQSIRRVIGYRVVDRFKITWTTADLDVDPNSPQYGQPEFYTITPQYGTQYRVHHSRISIIDGKRLPDDERERNEGWGASVLQGVYSHLMRVGEGYGYSANIMRDFVQSVLSIAGLSDMLANGQDDVVQKRINMLDMSRSVLNSIILDADNESYSKNASSVAGLADILDRHMEGLCGVAGIPMTKLVGRAPSGLNSNSDTQTRDYYDGLDADRAARISPIMEEIVSEIYLSKEGPTRGVEPDMWSIAWNSMYDQSDEEKASLRKTVAETDQIYWTMGAVDAEEVRDSRFANGDWTMETTIDTSGDMIPEDMSGVDDGEDA